MMNMRNGVEMSAEYRNWFSSGGDVELDPALLNAMFKDMDINLDALFSSIECSKMLQQEASINPATQGHDAEIVAPEYDPALIDFQSSQ